MSAGFRSVQWNRYKLSYDAAALVGVFAYVGVFLHVSQLLAPRGSAVDDQILLMRAFGSCAFILVTIILCIGPAARLDTRFLPLLYNRRHLGVITCGIALAHVAAVLSWYDAHGAVSPFVALLANNTRFDNLPAFPFEWLGLAVLLLLVVMAAISHDFWLAFLTPPVWKAIHMLLYPAYGLLVAHVALGSMQSGRSMLLALLVGGGFALVAVLHLAAGLRERPFDSATRSAADWLDVGAPDSIPDQGARIAAPAGGERIAIFRNGTRLSAVSNVCAHQNGPLGEGRILDGCVTCPWHGFQYRPEDGCAPPPFTEKLATYQLRLANGIVQVNPRPLPPGTYVQPLEIGDRA
jgi:nitrite reductase/ring-hydroxylating ferredoxin subunit